MLQIETFYSDSEDDLTNQVNYFLKQIDEKLIKDIKFSTSAFFDKDEGYTIIFSCIIIYIAR